MAKTTAELKQEYILAILKKHGVYTPESGLSQKVATDLLKLNLDTLMWLEIRP